MRFEQRGREVALFVNPDELLMIKYALKLAHNFAGARGETAIENLQMTEGARNLVSGTRLLNAMNTAFDREVKTVRKH